MPDSVIEVLHPSMFPKAFCDVDHLEEFLSTPTAEVVEDLANIAGDVILLGVAGKMGVTLARMIKRAATHKRVVGVARFSDHTARDRLDRWGIETIPCDLLDPDAVHALPKLENVIYLAGMKFDYRGCEDLLWAMNTIAPANVARSFAGSRIIALSTIHVYPWSNPIGGGVTEGVFPLARPGEYANSVVGRERTFQYYSGRYDTPGRLVRFVYAVDPRYGVLQEIAQWVLDRKEIPLETGSVNIMWQGDAICQFTRLLRHCDVPATPINVGNPGLESVRYLASEFGRIFEIEPRFRGEEAACLAVNCNRAAALLGNPVVPVATMISWVAEWTASGKPTLGKPSKFQVRDGVF